MYYDVRTLSARSCRYEYRVLIRIHPNRFPVEVMSYGLWHCMTVMFLMLIVGRRVSCLKSMNMGSALENVLLNMTKRDKSHGWISTVNDLSHSRTSVPLVLWPEVSRLPSALRHIVHLCISHWASHAWWKKLAGNVLRCMRTGDDQDGICWLRCWNLRS